MKPVGLKWFIGKCKYLNMKNKGFGEKNNILFLSAKVNHRSLFSEYLYLEIHL